MILDKKNGKQDTHTKWRNTINNIINSCNLIDIWRASHPEQTRYTWHSNGKPAIFCRLDYFLISENLCNIINRAKIKPGYKTDHSLIEITIDNKIQDKGPGYFKLNNTILLKEDYQTQIKHEIKSVVELNKNSNPNTLWELIKGTVRNVSIKFSSMTKKRNQEKEHQIIKKLETLEKQLNNNTADDENIIKSIRETKLEYENIIEEKINGMLIRARAIHIDQNEKSSKYFANLEKRHYDSKTIHKLKINNKEIRDTKTIRRTE